MRGPERLASGRDGPKTRACRLAPAGTEARHCIRLANLRHELQRHRRPADRSFFCGPHAFVLQTRVHPRDVRGQWLTFAVRRKGAPTLGGAAPESAPDLLRTHDRAGVGGQVRLHLANTTPRYLEPLCSWLKEPAALFVGGVPPASLDHLVAWGSPQQLGRSP